MLPVQRVSRECIPVDGLSPLSSLVPKLLESLQVTQACESSSKCVVALGDISEGRTLDCS